MLLKMTDGTLSVGGNEVLTHADFEIKGTEKIAIVGANGAGKTTFLRLLAGGLELDRDDRRMFPGIEKRGSFTVGMLSQTGIADKEQTVEEYCFSLTGQFEDDRDSERYRVEFDKLLTGFGFALSDRRKKLCEFSGGEQTRISLIELLLRRPDLLLLDEPTNHLDMAGVEWLEQYILAYPKAVCMISHDRFFLDRCAEIVYELHDGKLDRYPGNYTAFRLEKEKKRIRDEKAYEAYLKEQERLGSLVEHFKHKPRKASFARAKKKVMERMPKPQMPEQEGTLTLQYKGIPEIPGSKIVVDAQDVRIGYNEAILTGSLRIRRGQKIGILGDNGTGKSTFLKTIAGKLPVLEGKMKIGEHIQIGYFEQFSSEMDSDKSVLEVFHDRFPSVTERDARNFLAGFLFPGPKAAAKVSDLSGGEKARFSLALLLYECPNFLILDEPTNHMDIPTKERLEEALSRYSGTLLIVSHDRYLLARLSERLLVFQEREIYDYPFGYRHYLEHRDEKSGNAAAMVLAKDRKLIDEMRAVPKAERHESRPLTDEEAYTEWRLDPFAAQIDRSRRAFETACKAYTAAYPELIWEREEELRSLQGDMESLLEEYTNACLAWYDELLEIENNPKG